ncbi:hypothetical protein O181_028101 [Austropuccinia psidii MF-1]|uniref:Uncharacterized protein n=1 Tax=Austropuccinia psidii MF-1 TaxID=1389203 RepID=A0A9Q3CNI1_9BASI|nr:hypothetical protein [Austropuccinia psidii MF-1]
MDQQSISKLPPLPEDSVEGQYEDEDGEEDQTVKIQSFMKQMKDFLLIQTSKKGKRRQSIPNTPGNSPREPKLPRHIRLEYSPISPTPGPRANFTPETDPRIQNLPKRAFVSTPNSPSPLQKQVLKQGSSVVKIKAKDYNINLN